MHAWIVPPPKPPSKDRRELALYLSLKRVSGTLGSPAAEPDGATIANA
jgi:hypothetical protein